MPADQRNFGYSLYVSDDGTTYAMRADTNWIANADSGSAAVTGGQPRYMRTRSRHPRQFEYVDPTTFRKVREPVFTAAQYAAGTIGTSTFAVHVPGETATVTYTLAGKIPEKVPNISLKSTPATDHA